MNWIDKKNVWSILVGLLIVATMGKLCQFVSSNVNAMNKPAIAEIEPNKPETINPEIITKEPNMVEITVRKRSKDKSWCLSEIAKDLGTEWKEIAKLNNLPDPNKIYPGQKLNVIPYNRNPIAEVSWYGPGFQGKLMANREPFDMNDPTIVANKWLAIGTRVQLTRIDNGVSITVVVKDRGPYYKDRSFDLSMAAAGQLGIIEKGHIKCRVEIR